MKNRIKTKMIKILSGNRETRLTVQVADTHRKREKGLMLLENYPKMRVCYCSCRKKYMVAFG